MTPPPPSFPSELARYRLLSPTAGVRVSPLCLGTLNFGQAWKDNMGSSALDKEAAFELLDLWFQKGGNFIDTANGYQAGSTEELLGEWLEMRGHRDQIVLSTKFSMNFKFDRQTYPIRVNYTGNHTKSLRLSIKNSLARLKSDYVDILYVHFWDYTVSIPELMQALNDQVRSGRVSYLGASDIPAWIVSKANEYARHHGMAQFVIYQGEWSLLNRDVEREIIPMCIAEGMALVPYGVLGQGKFKSQRELEERKKTGLGLRSFWGPAELTENEKTISEALERVAQKVGTSELTQVALAYHLSKIPYVFPVFGVRTKDQLLSNIKALEITLDEEDIQALESVVPFKKGFPYDQFGSDPHATGLTESWPLKMSGHIYSFVPREKPLPLKATSAEANGVYKPKVNK